MRFRTIIIFVTISVYFFAQDSLQNLTIATARNVALEHNELLRKSQNERQKSIYDRRAAFRAALPTVDASVGAMFVGDQEIMGNTLQMKGAYLAGFTLTQPIYTGGKIIAANKLAKLGVACSEEQLRQVRMQVIADVDNAYWTWVAVREKVKLLEVYKAQMDSIYTMIEATVRVDMATEHDLLRIDAKRSELIYQMQKAVNGEILCRLALANEMGVELPAQALPADTIITPAIEANLSDDISARPEYTLLQKNIEVKHQQKLLEVAEYLPTLALTGGYTWYGNIKFKGMTSVPSDLGGMALPDGMGGYVMPFTQEMKANIPMAAIVLKVPILDWGVNFQKIRKAKLDEENARLDLERNSRLLSLEQQQARQNLMAVKQMTQAADIAERQAAQNLKNMTLRYEHHLIPLTDMLDAQSQWQQARSNQIEALTQMKIYETEYLRTSGILIP